MVSVAGLRYSMAAGYLPAYRVYASPFITTSYNKRSGGGGNCTRVPNSTNICPSCGYDMDRGAWPEHGRDCEALRELVANWHRLAPGVRDAIMELVRSSHV
jgi:hypothetical protein